MAQHKLKEIRALVDLVKRDATANKPPDVETVENICRAFDAIVSRMEQMLDDMPERDRFNMSTGRTNTGRSGHSGD